MNKTLKKNQRRLILYVCDSGDETKQLFQTQSSNDDRENCCACFFCLDKSWFSAMFLLVWVFFLRRLFCGNRCVCSGGWCSVGRVQAIYIFFFENVKSKKNLAPISGRMIP